MTIRLATDLLPDDPGAQHARLRDYFCDKDATARRTVDGWDLDLAWPGGTERHVDPRIGRELEAWGGIELDGMALCRRRSGRVLTALYDTWTLPSWSTWLARSGATCLTGLTVLHIDDHRDLGSPRLAIEADGMIDLITGDAFDVWDPASVLRACDSGAVGMGSFLTPFLVALPGCDVRQLGQPPKVTKTVDAAFVQTTLADDLLRPGAQRPAIRLDPAASTGPGRYRTTGDLADWLAGVAKGPILLHVDMDYFNNRYDGDNDWPDRHPRHDPPLDAVLRRIDEVTAAIRDAGLVESIVDAVVAFSPGFFPAEMWKPAEQRLRQGLEKLYG